MHFCSQEGTLACIFAHRRALLHTFWLPWGHFSARFSTIGPRGGTTSRHWQGNCQSVQQMQVGKLSIKQILCTPRLIRQQMWHFLNTGGFKSCQVFVTSFTVNSKMEGKRKTCVETDIGGNETKWKLTVCTSHVYIKHQRIFFLQCSRSLKWMLTCSQSFSPVTESPEL